MRRLVSSSVALILGIAVVSAQRGPAPLDVIALTNANVVNVRTGAIQRNATVILRGGSIESIGAAGAPAGARVIDLHNRYVVPGLIDTERDPNLPLPQHHQVSRTLLGRLGSAEEIAAAVCFLSGPGARYITGQTLHVNGGVYLG